jgi:hypothetical protein
MKLKFLLFALLLTALSFSQKATVSGVILDKEFNNEPLAFANITLKGTTIGTSTDENGKYTLSVSPGSHTLVIGFLGYKTVEIPITVKANEKKTVNYTLETEGVMLEDVVVSVAVNKEKESALLNEQKQAVEIKQSIGAQELSKKGISDVAAAVTKTTGVTKQEGSGSIFVRGMGDRYNSSSMNGLPIPSNDPSKKNIDLSIFSTDIVEYVSIDKVYNSKIYGDYAGGNIDIASKDYNGDGFFAMGLKSAVNTNAVSNKDFRLQDGPDFFGFKKINVPNNPLGSYNFDSSLNPKSASPYASGLSLTGGDRFKLGDESRLSFFTTLSFDNEYTSITDGFTKAVNNLGVARADYKKYESFSYNTNTTGLANIGFRINQDHKIKFNTLFINSTEQNLREYTGVIIDVANDGGFKRRNVYSKNSLLINQLLGEHKLTDRLGLKWGGSFNTVKADQPDRSTITLKNDSDNPGQFFIANNSASDNQRYFQNLKEDEIAANLLLDYKFSKGEEDDYKGKITFGYNGKMKKRDFEARQFNFKINSNIPGASSTNVDPNNIDAYFNQANFDAGYFKILTYRGGLGTPGALDPQTYNGEQTINSGLANIEYKFSKRFFAVLGIRVDDIYQKVSWKTQVDPVGDSSNFSKLGVLPNITAKYELTEKQNLRFGASKTYTLPQFKETALFIYEEITQQYLGNPDLYPSDNYNFDLKWEFFPKSEEIIALTAFGKYILNPINEVNIASSSNDITYLNSGDWGYAAGLEVEFKKNIFEVDSKIQNNKLSAGLNVSYMQTKQELNPDKVSKETRYEAKFTDAESSFSGASNFLGNADITFIKEWKEKETNIMATLTFGKYSDKVYAIGTQGRGNIVEKSVNTLDFNLKSKLSKNIGMGLNLKNLLNPKFRQVQENPLSDIVIQSFRKGINASLSINYNF